jgi:hypothetical protein
VEENRLKRCLKGGGGGDKNSGGGWICRSVTGSVTHKLSWKLIHDLGKKNFPFFLVQSLPQSFVVREWREKEDGVMT